MWTLEPPSEPGWYVVARKGTDDQNPRPEPQVVALKVFDGEGRCIPTNEYQRRITADVDFPVNCMWMVNFGDDTEDIHLEAVKKDTFWLQLPDVPWQKVLIVGRGDLGRDVVGVAFNDVTLDHIQGRLAPEVAEADRVILAYPGGDRRVLKDRWGNTDEET